MRAVTAYDGPVTGLAHDLMMTMIGNRIEVSARPRAEARSFERSGVSR